MTTTVMKKKNKNKFTSIETTLDTGLHYGNIEIIPKRRGELFRRLKTTEMVTLLQLYLNEVSKDAESIANLLQDDNDNDDEHQDDEDHEEKSVMNSIFHHHEYPEKDDENSKQTANGTSRSGISSVFLLLDIRHPTEFDKYHIKSARYYDMTTLRRDKLGNELYAFKNKPGKVIIICCEEENVGIRFANELCKKYIDNIFLLTSSVKRFCLKYPDLCVGHSFPEKPAQKKQTKARMRYVEWRPSNKRTSSSSSSSSVISMTPKFSHAPSVKSMMSTASSVRTWKP